MGSIREDMPLFAANEGRWFCHYRHETPEGELLSEHDVDILVEFPGEPGADYRQTTKNIYPDGSTDELIFEAQYDNKQISWDTDRIQGALWEVDDFTLYLRFGFKDQPGVEICEMIQLAQNGHDRTRTWHWFKDQVLFQRTLVTEKRVA